MATILFVGLLVIHSRPAPAMASGMVASAGSYQLVVGADATGDQELLYVINNAAGLMIAYRFDPGRKQILIVQGVDLSTLSGPAPKKGGRGRRP